MELEEGKIYSGKELAQGFGIRPDSYKANKQKKLEELKVFADYELVGNKTKKVQIKKVYNPIYSKQGSESYQLTKSKIDEVGDESGLDTCTRVSEVIYNSEDYGPVTKSTVYNYTLKGRNELYGKPGGKPGLLGHCVYQWSKKGEDGRLVPFTEEENAKKQELITKYYGDVTEKQLLIGTQVKAKKLSKEEAFDILMEWCEMDNEDKFLKFLNELKQLTGSDVLKGTMVYKEQLLQIEDKGYSWED